MGLHSNHRDSNLISYQKPRFSFSPEFFSQFASWAKLVLLSSHKRGNKKRKTEPQEISAVQPLSTKEIDTLSHADFEEADEIQEAPRTIDARSHFPNVWQRTALCRTTYQKLRQRSLPLWARPHLRDLLQTLQQQLLLPRTAQTSGSPTIPRLSLIMDRAGSCSPWSRKRYQRREHYALTAVAYTVDHDTNIVRVSPLRSCTPVQNIPRTRLMYASDSDSDNEEEEDSDSDSEEEEQEDRQRRTGKRHPWHP